MACDRAGKICKGYEVLVDGTKTTCRMWFAVPKGDTKATTKTCLIKDFPNMDLPQYK